MEFHEQISLKKFTIIKRFYWLSYFFRDSTHLNSELMRTVTMLWSQRRVHLLPGPKSDVPLRLKAFPTLMSQATSLLPIFSLTWYSQEPLLLLETKSLSLAMGIPRVTSNFFKLLIGILHYQDV